jgi:hypothetical protein
MLLTLASNLKQTLLAIGNDDPIAEAKAMREAICGLFMGGAPSQGPFLAEVAISVFATMERTNITIYRKGAGAHSRNRMSPCITI